MSPVVTFQHFVAVCLFFVISCLFLLVVSVFLSLWDHFVSVFVHRVPFVGHLSTLCGQFVSICSCSCVIFVSLWSFCLLMECCDFQTRNINTHFIQRH